MSADLQREQDRQARAIHGSRLGYWSAVLGVKLARLPLPTRRFRAWAFRTIFDKKYPPGLNEAEAELPLADYPTLNAVFTRGLKPACRPIPAADSAFLSPCDGTVQDLGTVTRGRILTLKNIEYSLDALLPGIDVAAFEGGLFAVIFLSPIDCHRVFCPRAGRLLEAVHVPGARLLVHPPFQRPEYPVYTLNERMVFRFTTARGPSVVVMVAGWGVGHITVPLAPDLKPQAGGITRRAFAATDVRAGDWLATFELGSTVVLLAPPAPGSVALVSPNDKVRYGQPLFADPA